MFERYSDRARGLIFMALWSALKRGGQYIEPEDLLHALIREDRGEFPAVGAQLFPGATGFGNQDAHRPFFADDVAGGLLRELNQDPNPLYPVTSGEQPQPVPHVDLPLSGSLKRVLGFVAQAHQNDTKVIEPLDLLAALLEDRDSRLARLLTDRGISASGS